MRDVLAAVAASHVPRTAESVANEIGASLSGTTQNLRYLLAEGQVVRSGSGLRGAPRRYAVPTTPTGAAPDDPNLGADELARILDVIDTHVAPGAYATPRPDDRGTSPTEAELAAIEALADAALEYGKASTAIMDEIERMYAGGRVLTDADRLALADMIPRARRHEQHTREMLEVHAKAYAAAVAARRGE